MTIKFNFPHVSEYDELARVPSRTNLYDENGNVITDEQNGIKSDITMKPMCFKGDMNLAVDNRGRLLPCCHCDTRNMTGDKEWRKLLEKSKIEDYNTLEEIIDSEAWKAFYKSLQHNRGPVACWDTCRSNKKKKDKQEMTVAEGGKLKIWERK